MLSVYIYIYICICIYTYNLLRDARSCAVLSGISREARDDLRQMLRIDGRKRRGFRGADLESTWRVGVGSN